MSNQIKSADDKMLIKRAMIFIVFVCVVILVFANHRPWSMYLFLAAAIGCLWFALKLYYKTERIGIAIAGWVLTLILIALAVWPAYDLKW